MKTKPLSPFMQAIITGDRQEIERMMRETIKVKDKPPEPEPVRGEGFVLVKDQGDNDASASHDQG